MGSHKGRTRTSGCIPRSPSTPDHWHSLAASHLEHGSISPLSMPPHQRKREIGEMASVRLRATHATGHTRSTSDRLLFRRHRSGHVQRATTNTLPTALSADLRRVGRTLRRPADIEALRLLNREQWRQLERDIAEES